jgi:hypothetical protein
VRCLLDSSVVPCNTNHNAEEIYTQDCDEAAVIDYLGGDPNVDILSPNIEISPVDAACRVRFEPHSGASVEGALRGHSGEDYRYCVSLLPKMKYTPCSTPHAGELVYLTGAAQNSFQCESEATTYLGTPWAQVSSDLSLKKVSAPGQWGCLAVARGGNSLLHSLRNLGQGSLPIANN